VQHGGGEVFKVPNRQAEGVHQVGIFVDLGSLCAEFTVVTVPEPEMQRLNLPLRILSQNSVGKGS
jgi:hypothetical protein